jgi:WD40 repeat protein
MYGLQWSPDETHLAFAGCRSAIIAQACGDIVCRLKKAHLITFGSTGRKICIMQSGVVFTYDWKDNNRSNFLYFYNAFKIEFSPDDKYLAVLSTDRFTLIDAQSDEVLEELSHANVQLWGGSFFAGGAFLAGRRNNKVAIFSIPSLEEIQVDDIPADFIAVSKFDSFIAVKVASGPIRVYTFDSKRLKLVSEFGRSNDSFTMAFTANPSRLACIYACVKLFDQYKKYTYKSWDFKKGECKDTLFLHTKHFVSIPSISPSGMHMAVTCAFNLSICVFNLIAWSDKTNQLFAKRDRQTVFLLMCVRKKIETRWNGNLCNKIPSIAMELWLMIMAFMFYNRR